jgi:hypothetical protein
MINLNNALTLEEHLATFSVERLEKRKAYYEKKLTWKLTVKQVNQIQSDLDRVQSALDVKLNKRTDTPE